VFSWLDQNVLWLIPAAPLAACVWIVVAGQFLRRANAHRPVVLALFVAAASAAYLACAVVPQTFSEEEQHDADHHAEAHGEAGHGEGIHKPHGGAVTHFVYQWFHIGSTFVPMNMTQAQAREGAEGIDVKIELRADAMSALMLLMVTSVSLLVAIFASGYMHGDPGYPRFFAALSLFVFSMCMLVLSSNFLMLFVFWEAVGLCSYLLIGFWFHKPSAAAAAKKAFVVNRIGDLGLILGIFLIWTSFGSVDFSVVLDDSPEGAISALLKSQPEIFTTICLLLFVGAVGKSAQFPLHVWLPDAMEGPTPVSALIHAATMVTAGVYLVSRCAALFVHAPFALMVVAGIGAVTALISAITALNQYDLKRVLAYSTVSQLGYMFMSLGAAGADPQHLMQHAVTFAMFHMFTHAFFKAVLFLSAGSVMHAMGDVIDMRRFSGLRKSLPITHATFLAGSLALAGFPLLSGFWSKDEILAILFEASKNSAVGWYYMLILGISMLTALMTAFYTFRAYFLTFWGPEVFPEEAGHHPHDAPPAMAGPLFLLAAAALGIGLLLGPTHFYAHYLHHTPGLPGAAAHAANYLMMGLSTVIALVGIGAAYALYGQHAGAAGISPVTNPLANLSLNGLYLDQLWLALVVKPLRNLAELSELIDRLLIDKLVDGVALIPGFLAALVRPIQNGFVQHYAFVMLLGMAAGLVWMLQALAAAP
jgi:NADH-quinone oxidoreductase subunit L